MSGEAIEIEYQLTADDLAKFSADTAMPFFGKPKFKQIFPQILMAFLILIFCSCFSIIILALLFGEAAFFKQAISFFYDSSLHYFFILFVPFTFLFVVLVFMFPDQKAKHKRFYNYSKFQISSGRNLMHLLPRWLKVSDGGLYERSEHYEATYSWRGVEKIAVQNGDLCIFVSAITAILIPSRFFKSEEEKQRVYAQCAAWFEAAREKPAEGAA